MQIFSNGLLCLLQELEGVIHDLCDSVSSSKGEIERLTAEVKRLKDVQQQESALGKAEAERLGAEVEGLRAALAAKEAEAEKLRRDAAAHQANNDSNVVEQLSRVAAAEARAAALQKKLASMVDKEALEEAQAEASRLKQQMEQVGRVIENEWNDAEVLLKLRL